MHEFFKDIKSVGFDLDQTLYPSDPRIDRRIQIEIAKKILAKKPGFSSLEKALEFSERRYSETGSRTQVFEEVGYENTGEILYECLVLADILDLITRDERLVLLFDRIREKYQTFLITNNPFDLAVQKLNKLGIDYNHLTHFIFASLERGKKTNGRLFDYFLSHTEFSPQEHVYVGDSLKADILPAKIRGMKTIGIGAIQEADFSVRDIYGIESLVL
jgi:FMN phosphatase YigB (HAD superfamily)